ncbi:MAG: acyl-CoA dehydrogenase [Deltaproteobacteria bacterium]|nr:acyl-CoA dehydrogenase [Deltaproteobacteria bacterium]
MDFNLSAQEETFRDQLRAWLAKNLPKDARRLARAGEHAQEDRVQFLKDWAKKVYDGGWAGVSWPKEYGGVGATLMEQVIFNEEMARAGAPEHLNVIGLGMTGPTIIAHGTEGQKKRYLAKILSAEEIWCQGFSEPNAGSDLAGLQCRAERDGDDFIVNGQKVWTSLAHIAQWCILLVRTDSSAAKHAGITYLLVDMASPGITVRPLVQITGDAEFNEIYFENVRVPVANVLGGINQGWHVAITTLMHERGTLAIAVQVRFRMLLDQLLAKAKKVERNGRPVTEDPIVRQKLAQMHIEVELLKPNGYRSLTKLLKGEPGPEGSIGKLFWSELNQRLEELAVEILGPSALLQAGSKYAEDDGFWLYQFLRSRGNTIEAGTSEIQKNIISERVLGLPRG